MGMIVNSYRFGSPLAPNLDYVGGKGITAGPGVPLVVPMTSGFTDGLSEGASVGDFVLLFVGAAESGITPTQLPGGVSLISTTYPNDTVDTRFSVYAGVLTDTNSAEFVASGTSRALACTVAAFGGLDAAQPAAAYRFTSGTNTGDANPPPILAEIDGCTIIAAGAGGFSLTGSLFNDPSDLTDVFKAFTDPGLYPISVMHGQRVNEPAGIFDPAAFVSPASADNASWGACTIVLVPAGLSDLIPDAVPGATSYTNPGGSGARDGDDFYFSANTTPLGSGNWATMFNGVVAENVSYFGSGSNVGRVFVFDFERKRVIDEFRWHQSSTSTHGLWAFQGSQDSLSWTDLVASFTLGGATLQTVSVPNTEGYRHYRLIGISGNASSSPWLREIEFKISP